MAEWWSWCSCRNVELLNVGVGGVVDSSNRRMANGVLGELVESSNRRIVEGWNGGMMKMM